MTPLLAVLIVLILIFGSVYMRARYHSFNWLEAPPRIDVAGRTYEGPEPFTRAQVLEDSTLPDGRTRDGISFNKIGWLPPLHSIYAFGPTEGVCRCGYTSSVKISFTSTEFSAALDQARPEK